MTKQVQLRRGTTVEHSVFTGAVGELTINTDLDIAVVHDGSTVGGWPLVGTAATQRLINKLAIGIGTTNPTSQLTVIGDTLVSGAVTSRSLRVITKQPISRSGTISGFSTNTISGISTNDIHPNDLISSVGLGITSYNISSIGIGKLYTSQYYNSGLSTSSIGYFVGSGSTTVVGVNTIGIEVGYGITSQYILPNTTIITVDEFGFELSQPAINPYDGFINVFGDTVVGSSIITGISTTGILVGAEVRDVLNPNNFPDPTYVTNVGISTITVDNPATGAYIQSELLIVISDLFYSAPFISTNFTISNPTTGKAIIDDLTVNTNVAIGSDVTVGNNISIGNNLNVTNSLNVGSLSVTGGISGGALQAPTLYGDAVFLSTINGNNNIIEATTNTNISGILTSRGFAVPRRDPINRQGVIFRGEPKIISGISTTNIQVGDAVSTGGTWSVSAASSVTRIGINTLYINGVISDGTLITSTGYLNGALSNTILGINTAGISIGYGIGNNSVISYGSTVTNIGLSSITFSPSATNTITEYGSQNGNISIGSTGISGINTSTILVGYTVFHPSFAEPTLVTSIGISTITVSSASTSTGISTTIVFSFPRTFYAAPAGSITTSFVITSNTYGKGYIDNLQGDVSTYNTGYISTAFVNSGVVTTAYISNAYINSGIITALGITTASTQTLYANSGIITALGITTASTQTLYAQTGIITALGITTASTQTLYANSGIITSIGISTGSADYLYIRAGVVTEIGISSAYINRLEINTGITTGAIITSAQITNAYVNSGVVTTLGVTNAFAGNLYAQTGIITSLSVTGISTLGNVVIGNGTTDLIVKGNARITGVLTVGGSSVTITNQNVTGVQTFQGAVGIFTNVQVAGINTFNSLRTNVTLKTSQLGIATNYDLVLPPNLGARGQVLALDSDGKLGFSTGTGLFENRYYVSSVNGDDANDGKALPLKTIKRASQLASFDSFIIPGQRYLDAGDLLDANKEFIKEEVVAYLEFNYENIAVSLPDYDAVICKRDVGYIVDALAYDVRFGGNSKSRAAGLAYWSGIGTSYVQGEIEQAVFAYEYIKFITQYIINNQSPPTLYQTSVAQTFDFTLIQDPLNTNTYDFHRSKDARNLIVGNRQEIIDKSLASVAVGVGSTFFFPGETESNTRSRYYDSYKLIQVNKQEILDKSLASVAIGFPSSFYFPGDVPANNRARYYDSYSLIQVNKQEIIDYAWAATVAVYPGISTTQTKCKRDLGYFIDAVSTDVFTGGNNYSRRFVGFYFDGSGNPLNNGLVGEETQSIYAFDQARIGMSSAITNQLSVKRLYITADPITGSNTSTNSCANVRSTIATLVGIVTTTVGLGTTTSLPTANLGYFNVDGLLTGIGTTSASPGGTICARDLSFFIDAVSTDVFTGGNNYSRRFVGFYFDAFGNPITNGLVGETSQSNYVFNSARDYMKMAITNTLNDRDLTITADPITGFNTSPSSCSNVQSNITTLVGIITTVVAAGSTVSLGATTNFGYFVVNPTYNVNGYVGIATTSVVGGRKCARDIGYIVDAIAQDVSYGTNQHILYATKKYFNGAGTARTDGLLGEEGPSVLAFNAVQKYSKLAINNLLNYQDLTIIADSAVGSNKKITGCADIQSNIDNLVGILTTAVLSGSLVGIAATNLGSTDCADVRSALVNYVGIITTIVGLGTTAAPTLNAPQTQSQPVCIIVEAGEYLEDNPILLYDDVAVVGDNLRNTIIRPSNAGKDLFRVRNGVYLTGFAMKDSIDLAGIPQNKFDYAVAFDDPTDPLTSRFGYATKLDKPTITRSPYIQNCSILSFLGANGILVDGAKVQSPNTPIVKQEVESPLVDEQPEQGKSMVAAAFTMVSFGGIGWRTINDGYAQVVSCFQIFCRYGSLAQSGGYLSITNSATNFGRYALRATGSSKNSFAFDRGRVASTGTSGGLQTLKAIGYGRSDVDNYVLKFFDNNGVDRTSLFKPAATASEFNGATGVGVTGDTITITTHPFSNGDTVVYNGDEQLIPPRIVGGLVNDTQYYVGYVDSNTIQLYEDEGFSVLVNLTSISTGIHTLTKSSQDFYVNSVITSSTHNQYQKLTLTGIGSTAVFVSGRLIQQTITGGTAIGYALTYNNSNRELIVGLEYSAGVRKNFAVTGGSNLTIEDHSASPISIGVTIVAGISTYYTIEFKTDSTISGNVIQSIGNLPENYRLHFHRPSIINSSGHTWEFSGSGTDYNALPQNGGQSDVTTEQVFELGGRVYASGTNELGDFKIGESITAFNRTGNIIFNNTVTIGVLDSLRLSLSGGNPIEEFSTDSGLGDNEIGGPKNNRVSTQLATRSFLNNRLGSFIDKSTSTSAIPGAIVQLNAAGQINADLIPPKTVNYYRTSSDGGRIQLVNLIPATNLSAGDVVVEPSDAFVLINDLVGQYLILNNNTVYNFQQGDIVTSVVSGGGAIGIVTAPPSIGINTTVVDPAIGYGSTGLVRGVALTLNGLNGGSGYTNAGIYTGVRLDPSTGIGTGISATITVSAAGTVSNVAINTGGRYFASGNVLTLNDPTRIGGRTGGSNFTVTVNSVETRLYLTLTNNQKFPGSAALSDYISDRNSVGVSSDLSITYAKSFNPTDISVAGDIDFANDRIVVGVGHSFVNGDPITYTSNGGTVISQLIDNTVYYIKTVGITSVQLFTTYSLATIKSLDSSGTGTHTITRSGVTTSTDQIVFKNHGFVTGDPVKIIGSVPTGITTGNFYFVGSVTQNSFTLHTTYSQSVLSSGGLILNAVDLTSSSSGIVTFTKQNIVYSSSVNTSSGDLTNFSLLSTNSLDAANIISGTIAPTRLGSGSANSQTFLRGDSSYQKVVMSVGIGTTQPFGVTATTSDLAPGGVGINTYYGNVNLTLNRVAPASSAEYSTLGISKYKTSTFLIGADGAVTIKSSTTGDIDATTLGGQNGAYYLALENATGSLPISRGGSGLAAAPSLGFVAIGNGSNYTLTGSPEFAGVVGAGYTVLADKDISFGNGTWTGDKAAKIQYSGTNLYNQFTGNWIARNSGGTDILTINNNGNSTFSGIVTGSRFISNVATGTVPITLTSTTECTNLNAALLNGYASATANTLNAIVRRDGSGNFTAGTISATTFTSTQATGTAPFTVTSTTQVSNLNAQYVNGKSVGTSGNVIPLLDGTNTWSAGQTNYFISNSAGLTNAGSTSPNLQVYTPASSTNSAYMSFHRAGVYAVNFGLDTDSILRIGGWSAGTATRWSLDPANGNMTCSGTFTASSNITAYSDIRLKKNISTIQNALDKVLNLRGVEYDRIDSEEHHIGVIAQEVETIIPEVINTDTESGYKTVAYGNLAGLFIEAIKQQNEVINNLKEEIDILKLKLNQ